MAEGSPVHGERGFRGGDPCGVGHISYADTGVVGGVLGSVLGRPRGHVERGELVVYAAKPRGLQAEVEGLVAAHFGEKK